MTKANIELPNGTRITVEGTPEEVSKAIRLLQGNVGTIKTSKSDTSSKKEVKRKSYSGASGGISLLLDEKFLDSPKSVKEIETEMIRQGYHYPQSTISKLLAVNFMRNSKKITRIKEDKKWKYVIRK